MRAELRARLGDLAERLGRLFVGRLPVHRLEVPSRELTVRSSRRVPVISSLCLTPEVHMARCLDWARLPVRTTAMGPLLRGVACRRVPLDLPEISARRGLSPLTVTCGRIERSRLVALPQERSNRIRFLKNRWKSEGASALALFSPIIRGSLSKSILDKQSGSLLCWVDPSSRATEPFFLLLLRRRDKKGHSLEWLWFPLPGE